MISTHVLDTERGRPAAGVRVELYRGDELLAAESTDGEGRIAGLGGDIEPGTYRLVFLPASSAFFERLEVVLALEAAGHFHIPLLLSSYACTIYRGS